MDLSDVDLMNYQTERDMYQAGKLGFLEPEPELKRSPFVHRQSQSGWSRFWAAAKRFFDKAVEEGVDR